MAFVLLYVYFADNYYNYYELFAANYYIGYHMRIYIYIQCKNTVLHRLCDVDIIIVVYMDAWWCGAVSY